MTKIIEELWDGQVIPIEFSGKTNNELRMSEANLLEKIDALSKSIGLSESNELQQLANECLTLTAKQAFCDGFSLGTRITAEAFLTADQLHP